MKRMLAPLVCFVLASCDAGRVARSETSSTPLTDDAKLLALGHQKFMEGCATCHDERGDKPLTDGAVLCEIEFTEADLAEKVSHRAHDFSPGEQAAILRYVESILLYPPVVASAQ